MKKRLVAILAVGFFSFGTAQALTINNGTTDVGGLDTLMASTPLENSGDQTEIDWVNGYLKTNYTSSSRYPVTPCF